MKTVLLLLLTFLLNCSLIAQSNENYRMRNYKLNKKYHSKINSKKHRFAYQKSTNREEEVKKDKIVSNFPRKSKSNNLTVKNNNAKKNIASRNKFQDQNPTLPADNKKNGKKILNFFTMLLALSLIIAN